jgi:TetR/AcrR family transcriptional repressor of mexJK operon
LKEMQIDVAGSVAGDTSTNEGCYQGSPFKQESILKAATAVFLREGFKRASVDAIAAEADVSKRTIYNHFADKKDLFLTVIKRARERAALDFVIDDARLQSAETLRDDLVVFANGMIRGFTEPDFAAMRRLVVGEVNHYPELNLACKEGTPKRVKEWFGDRIEALAERGILDSSSPRRAAEQFIGLLVYDTQRFSTWGTESLSEEQINSISNSATDFFLKAYFPDNRT